MSAVPKFYTTGEVAEIFRVKSDTVREWIKDGKIKATKVGSSSRGRLLISHEEVTRMADRKMET